MSLIKSNSNRTGNGLWSDLFDTERFFNNRWFEGEFESVPAVNVKETDEDFSLEFAAPGYSKGDFTVNVEGNTLSISAEKESESEREDGRFTRKEFSYNSFERHFTLPQAVVADKTDASYKDGILKVRIPKQEKVKTQVRKAISVA